MTWIINARTDKGCERTKNEDGFFVNGIRCPNVGECSIKTSIQSSVIAVVIDGVGGCLNGDIATDVCISQIDQFFIPRNETEVISLIDNLNNKVCEVKKRFDTACTIAGICITEGAGYWFNVGDSRVYEINHGYLNQLSIDDTASGILGEESKNKEPLIQYLGSPKIIPHVGKINTKLTHLICTDGLTDMIEIDDMEDIISSISTEGICNILVDFAKEKGGKDNITLMVLDPKEAYNGK